MSKSGWKYGVLLLAVLLVFAAGCGKKVVKGGDQGQGAGGTSVSRDGGTGGPGNRITTDGIREDNIARDEKGNPILKADGTPMTKAELEEQRRTEKERIAGIKATENVPSPFQDIYFDFDQSSVREDAKPVLQQIAAYMQKNPDVKLVIEGHCDSRGTAEYNMALGERRAESVKKYLIALGVKPASLSTVSYGKEKPLVQGDTEDAWAKNRRAHFVLPEIG